MANFIRGAAVMALLGAFGYLAVFTHTARTSLENMLPPGRAYHFCGLYLDCHLSATIEGVEVSDRPAGGARYLVRVRFASNALQATLGLEHPEATLLADHDVRLGPVAGPDTVRLRPDQSVVAEFLFESPTVLTRPRLYVTKGGRLERLSERFLIGDPDSYGHAPITLALPGVSDGMTAPMEISTSQ